MLSGLSNWHSGEESAYQCRRCNRHRFDPWVGKIFWRKAWLPTSELLPGKCHGQKSLVGYHPWGHKELDTAEHTHFKILFNTTETTMKKHNFNTLNRFLRDKKQKYVDIILLVNSLTTLWNRCSLTKDTELESGKDRFQTLFLIQNLCLFNLN